jgi:hypothetical protein
MPCLRKYGQDDDDVDSEEEMAAIGARNEVRKALRRAFKSHAVFALPPPHRDVLNTDDLSVSNADLTDAFGDAVAGLRGHISECLRGAPHTFGADVITPQLACAVLPAVVAAVNEGAKDLPPPTMVAALHMSRCGTAAQHAFAAHIRLAGLS